MTDVRRAIAPLVPPGVLILLGVMGTWFLIFTGLPDTSDGAFHVYRLLALDRAIGAGLYFPRILPDLLYGYGYPLFNYYPPMSSYFSETLHLLGLGYIGAVRAAYALAIVLSGLSMYVFARSLFADARENSARWAGTVAAAAYMFNPYLLITVYTRGALAEALSFPLAALLFWLVRRMSRSFDSPTFIATAFATATVVLMHSGLAAVFLPAIALFGLVSWLCTPRGDGHTRRLGGLIGALVVGLALSAFFWLPAALERDYVSWSNLTTGWYDFRQHFLSPGALFSTDLAYPLTHPHPIPPRLGWLTLVLAAGGLVFSLLRRGQPRRWDLAFLFLLGLVSIPAMLPFAQPLWERAPLLAMLSFPWRLFAIIAVAWSPLAGALVSPSARLRIPVGLALVAAIGLYALPTLAPSGMQLDESQVTIDQSWRREFQTSMVGTTSANEYVPVWVKDGAWGLPRVPDGAYQNADKAPSRLQSDVVLRRYSPLSSEFDVSSPVPTSLSLHAVFFPGWQALVDGHDTPVQSSGGGGLVSVQVPAGAHRLVLQFGDTGTRQIGAVCSLVALACVGLFVLIHVRRRCRRAGIGVLGAGAGLLLGIVAAGLPTGAGAALQPLNARMSDDLELLSATIQPASSASGEVTGVLYWLSRGYSPDNRVVRFSLRRDNREVGSWERVVGGPFSPTKRWVDGEVVADSFSSPALPAIEPGPYELSVSMRDGDSRVVLGQVQLSGTQEISQSNARPPAGQPYGVFGDDLELLDADIQQECCQPAAHLSPGEKVRVVLHWEARRVMSHNYTVFVHLVDEAGRRLAQHDGEPGEDKWPTMLWDPGESVADVHELDLPPDVASATVRLLVGVYFRPTMQRLPVSSQQRPVVESALDLIETRIQK